MNEVEVTWKVIAADVLQVLNYKLFEIDGHGVSLAKLLTGLLLLFLGYFLSLRASREVDRRVFTRFGFEESLRYTLQRFLFYFFLAITTLFTLRTLNVPITIFTVIGGALAVGIGFGSQNLVNNFISGILVMVERPIRVGDFVEVDGLSGVVQSIGIRATVVRAGSGALVVIPNTVFIENKLINWSISGQISGNVRLGVAYGTDMELFRKICEESLAQVPAIRAAGDPPLVFVDFGDNALLFDLAYYIDAGTVPMRRSVESALRFELNARFERHKISIPFPQRDVHLRLDSSVPLKVGLNEA